MVKVDDLVSASVSDNDKDGTLARLDGVPDERRDTSIKRLLGHFGRPVSSLWPKIFGSTLRHFGEAAHVTRRKFAVGLGRWDVEANPQELLCAQP
jgi:hypothetical protein